MKHPKQLALHQHIILVAVVVAAGEEVGERPHAARRKVHRGGATRIDRGAIAKELALELTAADRSHLAHVARAHARRHLRPQQRPRLGRPDRASRQFIRIIRAGNGAITRILVLLIVRVSSAR